MVTWEGEKSSVDQSELEKYMGQIVRKKSYTSGRAEIPKLHLKFTKHTGKNTTDFADI